MGTTPVKHCYRQHRTESSVAHKHYSTVLEYSPPQLLDLHPAAPQNNICQSSAREGDIKLTEITFSPNEQLVLQEPKHTTPTI